MKELLRKELIKTRERFMKLKDHENYLSFYLFADLNVIDGKNAEIIFKSFAVTEDQELVNLGQNIKITVSIEEFINLVKYAEERYLFQFSFEVNDLLSCIYNSDGMNFELFKFILEDLIEKEQFDLISNGNFGFIVAETIF